MPAIGLGALDPIGRVLSQACRETSVGLNFDITAQTYHSALALAHHGPGVALVDTCTAASADVSRVDVLDLEPLIPVPFRHFCQQVSRVRLRYGRLCGVSSGLWEPISSLLEGDSGYFSTIAATRAGNPNDSVKPKAP